MEVDQTINDMRPGNILHIVMENFVTYTKASLSMGPNINVICGPNGTGKSTIVAAIILGLGGNPKQVGRGTRVSEYVKHGCTEAKIQIILYDPNKSSKNVLITRQFTTSNHTEWKIDDKKVSINDVKDYTTKFNIQINNLCQFLPQDRVQEFSKLNKQDLLKQTKIALCREDLVQKKDILVQTMIDFNNSHKNLEKNIEKLQAAKNLIMQLDGKVKNLEKKKGYLKSVKDINRKIAWINYEEIVSKRNEVKEDRSKARELLNNRKKDLEPKEKLVRELQESIKQFQIKINNTDTSMKTTQAKITSLVTEITSLNEEINGQKQQMESQLKELSQRDIDIANYTKKRQALYNDKNEIISKYGNENEMKSSISNVNQNLTKLMGDRNHLDNKKSEYEDLKRNNMYERQGMENHLRNMENIKDQRLEYLRRLDNGAYQAVMWLRQNQLDFIGTVYEPMILELNVIDPKHALYLENVVARRDKIAFVCTEKQDMNLLIRVLRDQHNFSVNILYSEDRNDQNLNMYQPKIPIEHLKKYGFFAYLNSLVTGPKAIMKYLCKNYCIHQIPIGNESTNNHFEAIPADIRLFFSDKSRFSISYSKYTNQKISKQDSISTDGSFSISIDTRKLNEVKSRLEVHKRNFENLISEEKSLNEQVGKLMEMIKKEKDVMNSVKQDHQKLRMIEEKINRYHQILEQFKNDTQTVSQIEAETKQKINIIIKKMKEKNKPLKTYMTEYNNYKVIENVTKLKLGYGKDKVITLKNEIINIQDAFKREQELYDNLTSYLNTLTNEAKISLERAKKLSNGFTPAEDGFEPFREIYDKLDDTIEKLNEQKETIQNKIECLNSADENEIRKYEEQVQLATQLEEKVENANKDGDLMERKIETLEREYLEPLEYVIGQINEKFRAAYERMGCAGEVTVFKGDNPKDYDNFGISVKVSYRSGEPLQELNSLTQSGGEKAVATATYMLSMQELTPVPFRCVDEINQGMDETNERRIFRLLTETAAQPNTAQYILVTPKLIPKLSYVRNMMVHCVYSGPFLNL
ncbi:structural maintenance of chromosomes protein 5 [Onthophagus taurus]|uniref:structural maintenance of chromosomes protein 5 n=1 Tax=Onthophagus taurus TaxID=166361 RepID=UPI0039BE3AF0